MNMDVTELVSESGVSIGNLTVTVIARAALTLVIGLIIIRILLKLLDHAFTKVERMASMKTHIRSLVRMVLGIVLVIAVLEALNVKITSFVALLSVAAFAVSMALQNTLADFAGGLMVLANQPYSIGDFVCIDGTEGTVASIQLGYTVLITLDNREVILPNSKTASTKVINYNRHGSRRIDHVITASYDAPTEEVYAALRDAMARFPQILDKPAPETHLSEYGANSISYIARMWVAPADYWTVYFGVLEAIRETFQAHGVEMTYDHLNVHMVEQSPPKAIKLQKK